MQNLSEIRALLAAAGVKPNRRLGQNFLIDGNLMAKMVELADVADGDTILEVGPAMGSLTDDLLDRAERVVAVEMDKTLARILRRRLGDRESLTILNQDVLAGKHALAAEVLQAVGPGPISLVSNLPYSAAVPIIINCLLSSWRSVAEPDGGHVCFESLTVTIQRELVDRLVSGLGDRPDDRNYGPAGVIVALLARETIGRVLPGKAFWPRPKVVSQMLRLDFDAEAAAQLADADVLQRLLAGTFRHRRKKIATTSRTRGFPWPAEDFREAMDAAGVSGDARPAELTPRQFRNLAAALAPRHGARDVLQ